MMDVAHVNPGLNRLGFGTAPAGAPATRAIAEPSAPPVAAEGLSLSHAARGAIDVAPPQPAAPDALAGLVPPAPLAAPPSAPPPVTLVAVEAEAPQGADIVAPPSSRTPDLAALKLTPEKVEGQSIRFMILPEQALGYFDRLMGDKRVHLATAGYSAPPPGYEEPTRAFLRDLSAALNDDVGFLTSPTADKGSIDAITSEVGQERGVPIGYVTADSYLEYVNPDRFPPTIDRATFAAQPKLSMPDGAVYSKATAVLSNASLVTGGRNAAVSDFMNAIRQGNRAVVLTSAAIANPVWDHEKNRVDNASAYIAAFASGNIEGIPLDNPFNQEVQTFFADNQAALSRNLLIVDAADARASENAAAFLSREGPA